MTLIEPRETTAKREYGYVTRRLHNPHSLTGIVLGIISFVFALLPVAVIILVLFAPSQPANPDEFYDDGPVMGYALLPLIFLFFCFIESIAVLLGVAGVIMRDGKNIFAILGLVLSGCFFLYLFSQIFISFFPVY